MKHSSGRRDVEESNLDPAELWCQLGLLVIESRQPDESARGWREGPHCPSRKPRLPHECAPNANSMCKRKDAITREIRSLGRNNVPVCIEVVMLPECEGHDHKSDIAHGAMKGHYLLLEQWKFQVLPKRGDDVVMNIASLFQAVKSYLYFSQLSAWLNQTKGVAPKAVEYRVSPPAEFCTSTFQEPPELHRFPICSQQHYAIQVTVAALPRQQQLILLPCPDFETYPKLPYSSQSEHDEDEAGSSYQRRDVGSCKSTQERGAEVNEGTFLRMYEASQTGSIPTSQRKLASPGPEMMLGACGPARTLSPGFSPRSESPYGSTCAGYTNCSDVRFASGISGIDEVGLHAQSGGGVAVQSCYEYRDPTLLRSKTYKDFHSDDSSDCSESSTVVKRSKGTSENPVVFNQPRILQTSSSMQTIRERTASPKFYLPYNTATSTTTIQPSIERVSSPSSSSDSSQNGVSREVVLSPHKPSPPIDLYIPQRDSSESLSRKLATKLSFEPLPAFELEAHVCKSVPLDLPISSPFKPEGQSVKRQVLSHSQTTDGKCTPHISQKLKAKRCLDLSSNDSASIKPKVHLERGDSATVSSNGADRYYAIGPQHNLKVQATNGNITSFNDQQQDNLPIQNGASIQNGAAAKAETNGYHSYDTELQHNRFQVPKTPEKPLKTILSRHLQNIESNQGTVGSRHIPTEQEQVTFRKALCKSTAAVFTKATGLPLQSSPAPIKRLGRKSFDFDENLIGAKAIKNSLSCVNLEDYDNSNKDGGNTERSRKQRLYSASAPASTNSLLGNFEESLLNGRIEPCGAVDGFRVDIGASGSFCPSHVALPVTAFFFKLSEDNAPSPYLGHVNLESVGKRGYHIPSKGTIQVTLFNPNNTVVKMFVVTYDLTDMPPCCTTFLRQRTVYKPVSGSKSDTEDAPQFLKYLIHLRVASTKSKKLYLHSDIRLIFARDKFEYDSRIANYEYRSLTEGPVNPKYSPKK